MNPMTKPLTLICVSCDRSFPSVRPALACPGCHAAHIEAFGAPLPTGELSGT